MRNRFLLSSAALVLGLSLVAGACSSDSDDDATTTTAAEEATTTEAAADTSDQTIVEIASTNPDFEDLVTAVTAAGLAETLSGEGPFTVFAPTNRAFQAMPAGVLDCLLADADADDKEELAPVLQLHVISGEVDSAAATAAVGTCVDSLGGKVLISEDDGELKYGGEPIDADLDPHRRSGANPDRDPVLLVVDAMSTSAAKDLAIALRPTTEPDHGADFEIDL